MLQAMAKKITWWQARRFLGISDRTCGGGGNATWEEGYNGLLDLAAGPALASPVPGGDGGKGVALYRESYFDLNVQHFTRSWQAEHGIGTEFTPGEAGAAGSGLGGAEDASGGRIASGGSAPGCQGCCCISIGSRPPVVSGANAVRPDRDSG